MTPLSLASEVVSLFSLPDMVQRVCALMDTPTVSVNELVEVVELDAGIAATVLRLANSALYGHGRVHTLSHALAMIGQRTLRDLVLATSAVRTFKGIPEDFVDMNVFWENSVTCAVLGQQIARRARLRESEDLFIAGLLHGVGRLVFYARRPAEYRALLHGVNGSEAGLVAAERRAFGFSYAELGAGLLEVWGLPKKLRVAVAYHLNPAAAPGFNKEVAVLALANDMAAHLAPCLKTRDTPSAYAPGGEAETCLQTLELQPGDLDELSQEALAASLEVVEIIHPGASATHH